MADPEVAVGPHLGPPPLGRLPITCEHARWLRRDLPPSQSNLAVGKLPFIWKNGAARGHQSRGEVSRRCLCGRLNPSGAHLVWACSALADGRPPQPKDALGERLCVAMPPHPYVAPAALDSETCAEIEDLCRSAAAQEAEGATVALATDGSFKDGCMTTAIVGGPQAMAFRTPGPDASSTAAEFEGLRALPQGLVAAEVRNKQVAVFCDDSRAALAVAAMSRSRSWWRGQEEVEEARRRLRGMGAEVSLSWVPPHGQAQEWLPDDGLGIDASLARKLNELADRTAGASEWSSRLQTAKEWTRQPSRVPHRSTRRTTPTSPAVPPRTPTTGLGATRKPVVDASPSWTPRRAQRTSQSKRS